MKMVKESWRGKRRENLQKNFFKKPKVKRPKTIINLEKHTFWHTLG